MGLLRRKDERAIPKPGTPEFDEAVQGTALPDDQSVSMGEPGWTQPEPEDRQTEETGDSPQAAEKAEAPGRGERMLGALGRSVLRPPNADGFGGGLSAPKKKSRKNEPEK